MQQWCFAVRGAGVEGRILQATIKFVCGLPHPALLPVLSCFFDAIKETYNKNHIISFHRKKTPFTLVRACSRSDLVSCFMLEVYKNKGSVREILLL